MVSSVSQADWQAVRLTAWIHSARPIAGGLIRSSSPGRRMLPSRLAGRLYSSGAKRIARSLAGSIDDAVLIPLRSGPFAFPQQKSHPNGNQSKGRFSAAVLEGQPLNPCTSIAHTKSRFHVASVKRLPGSPFHLCFTCLPRRSTQYGAGNDLVDAYDYS